MDPRLSTSILIAFFALCTLAADHMGERARKWPIVLCALLAGLAFMEIARFDHGFKDTLVWVGWIGAPLVAIFGGAAWGVRKFYGWPDFGVHPPRAAAVALAILLGVAIGSRVKAIDVRVSQERVEDAARADVHTALPTSRMGWLAPPPIERMNTKAGDRWLFAVASDAFRVFDPASRSWRTHRGSRHALRETAVRGTPRDND